MDARYFSCIHVIDPLIKRLALRGSGVIIMSSAQVGKVASPIQLPGGAANAALMLTMAGLANAYAGRACVSLGSIPAIPRRNGSRKD